MPWNLLRNCDDKECDFQREMQARTKNHKVMREKVSQHLRECELMMQGPKSGFACSLPHHAAAPMSPSQVAPLQQQQQLLQAQQVQVLAQQWQLQAHLMEDESMLTDAGPFMKNPPPSASCATIQALISDSDTASGTIPEELPPLSAHLTKCESAQSNVSSRTRPGTIQEEKSPPPPAHSLKSKHAKSDAASDILRNLLLEEPLQTNPETLTTAKKDQLPFKAENARKNIFGLLHSIFGHDTQQLHCFIFAVPHTLNQWMMSQHVS